ncbi:DUF177 domain-containing protein [Anaerolineales bacterium HSG25]|nr:DUF177 domain-containing protein [Anaerolineales bacterium HSG25]
MSENKSATPTSYLEFNVSQLLKEGMGASRNFTVTAQIVLDTEQAITLNSPITGNLKLLSVGHNVLITGALQATVQQDCGRCLNRFDTVITIDLEEEFFPSVDVNTGSSLNVTAEVEETNLIDDQHVLDLTRITQQELILAAESIRYCREACLGLCPQCGQDLNLATCDCDTEKIDARWADLLTVKTTNDN